MNSFFFFFLTGMLTCSVLTISLKAQEIDPVDIGSSFFPAGYMGCDKNINIDDAWRENAKTPPLCYKITYTSTCPEKWAGTYWTNTVDDSGANWGQLPGLDLSAKRITRITFWAKGEKGGEVVEFGAFGIDNNRINPEKYPYKDNCKKELIKGRVILLEPHWVQYTINITCQDLSSIIGGFFWSASWNSNPAGLAFFLDDIKFE